MVWFEQSMPIVLIVYMRLEVERLFSNLIRSGSVCGVNRAVLDAEWAKGRSHSEIIEMRSL